MLLRGWNGIYFAMQKEHGPMHGGTIPEPPDFTIYKGEPRRNPIVNRAA
jgi:hypothetical protein